jgi:transcriptional regulator with XRE-family HTH domain
MSTSLGAFVRERRHDLGLTQEQLAERIGETVRQAEISRLEQGRISLPRRDRMEHLAAALEVSLGELLVRSGWMEEGDDLPERDLERDLDRDPLSWQGPGPEDIDDMTLPELVAMLERVGDEQDQLTAATIALEATRKRVTAEMQEEISEVRPQPGATDDGETPMVPPA